MLRPRINSWFWAELLTVAIVLRLLAVVAFISDARASGITNMLLGAGGASLLSTTLTAGSNVVTGNGEVGYCVTPSGVCGGSSIGSISVSSIPGGYTIEAIDDVHLSGTVVPKVVITGFSANPGASWLNKVTFNSQTFMGSAATFSYATGTGTWAWSGGFGFTNTDVYPGTITYQ